jgi:hypothetical protein
MPGAQRTNNTQRPLIVGDNLILLIRRARGVEGHGALACTDGTKDD